MNDARAAMRPDMSWLAVLEHHARAHPTKPVATMADRAVSYAEMVEWTAAVAGGLGARGVARGDVVGILAYNSIEFLTAIHAANHLGAVAMPINWRLAPAEVGYILGHSETRALVCDAALVAVADEAIAGLDHEVMKVVVSGDAAGW